MKEIMRGKSYTVTGTAWGDEAKAKMVDFVIEWLKQKGELAAVIRPNGGANAGHTVVVGDKKFANHLIAAGIFYPDVKCVSGSGMVIDPPLFLKEVGDLEELGVDISGRLIISEKAHLTFPWHIAFEKVQEKTRGKGKIGTTKRGIGPTYCAKALRTPALRAGDLLDQAYFKSKFMEVEDWWMKLLKGIGLSDDEMVEMTHESIMYLEAALKLRRYVRNIDGLAYRMIMEGQDIINEMAQGPLLDIDHGTVPFVTSSNSFPPYGLKDVSFSDVIVAVVKAYTTRVGEGTLVGEITGPEAELIQHEGNEFGTTTGRPRRISWLDLVATRYSIDLMRSPHTDIWLAVTKLDVLDKLKKIKVVTGYQIGDIEYAKPPSMHPERLKMCKPVHSELDGWQSDTTGCRRMEDLPELAQAYLTFISERLDCSVGFVSVGAKRSETIVNVVA